VCSSPQIQANGSANRTWRRFLLRLGPDAAAVFLPTMRLTFAIPIRSFNLLRCAGAGSANRRQHISCRIRRRLSATKHYDFLPVIGRGARPRGFRLDRDFRVYLTEFPRRIPQRPAAESRSASTTGISSTFPLNVPTPHSVEGFHTNLGNTMIEIQPLLCVRSVRPIP